MRNCFPVLAFCGWALLAATPALAEDDAAVTPPPSAEEEDLDALWDLGQIARPTPQAHGLRTRMTTALDEVPDLVDSMLPALSGSDRAPTTDVAATSGPSTDLHELEAAMSGDVSAFQPCIDAAGDDLRGRVVVSWRIERGAVGVIEVQRDSTGDEALADCIVGRILRWQDLPEAWSRTVEINLRFER